MGIADKLKEVVQQNRTLLREAQPAHVRELLRAAEQARRELVGRLQELAPGRFTAQSTRSVLFQVENLIDQIGREYGIAVGDVIEDLGTSAARLSIRDLEQQLSVWAEVNPGAERMRSQLVSSAVTLDPGLLEHYASSRLRYGAQAIQQMRSVMAVGLLQNDTMAQTADRLASSLGLKPYQAERIVRTEQSLSFHRQWLTETQELVGDDADDWRKELVATFDKRTGKDSRFVHGQRRKLDKPFEDNLGNSYQQPPNRPNDRETVVLVEAGSKLDIDV